MRYSSEGGRQRVRKAGGPRPVAGTGAHLEDTWRNEEGSRGGETFFTTAARRSSCAGRRAT
eukprot:438591-Pyramimonas_sp.AAC.1